MSKFYVIVASMLILVGISDLRGQSNPVGDFSLDGCDLSDDLGNLNGITFLPECACGVSSNGLQFNGTSSTAEFDQGVSDLISGDWSMTFYVLPDADVTESMDILFIGTECRLDSVLSLRYLPTTRRFRFILSDSPNNSVQLDGLADDNRCWQYVAITKEAATVTMFVNGQQVDEMSSISSLTLNVSSPLRISGSPCQDVVTNPDVGFTGAIDEIKFFDRRLTPREVAFSDLQPDRIITNDTTIFIGADVALRTGGSCSDNFSWTPTDGLNDSNLLNPIASPTEDITYTLQINGDGCTSIDQVTVRVADGSNVTCADLRLPNAFTPNNDLINDRFGISNQFLITSLRSFEIFNRWGGRVFFTNVPSGSWDGVYQNELAPADSYLYKVDYTCDDQQFTKTGSLHLIR